MQRCSKKAYAMCPTRHLCGPIEEATFSDYSECATFNREVEDKPMTNADRIRAMSDEQLENFINNFNICDNRSLDECTMSYCSVCSVCVLDWLQQPAEGEQL